jgi:hypothetical protein
MRAAWLVVLVAATGCNQILGIGDVTYGDGGIPVDAPPPPDADPTRPDADPSVPDANPLSPDANPLSPDAMAPDGPPGTVPLVIKNYLSWCTVSVNGAAAVSDAVQMVDVPSAAVVNLSAIANEGFALGATPWHDTDGDTGGGDPSGDTTVTVAAGGDCAWVCCELAGGGGCPTTDQCP